MSSGAKIAIGFVVSVIIVLMGLTLKTAYSMDKQITQLQQGQIILEHQKKKLKENEKTFRDRGSWFVFISIIEASLNVF